MYTALVMILYGLEAMVMVVVFMYSCSCYADLAFRLQQIDGASFRIGNSLTPQTEIP
jgi:hypothetical protein